MTTETLSPHDIRSIAVESVSDPRTVEKYIRTGGHVRGTARDRIARVIQQRGIRISVPREDSAA